MPMLLILRAFLLTGLILLIASCAAPKHAAVTELVIPIFHPKQECVQAIVLECESIAPLKCHKSIIKWHLGCETVVVKK